MAQTTSATDGNPAATHASCKTSLAVGRCHEALPICQAGLRETERRLGLEYEDVASWLLLVSRALQELGQYAQAEPISQRWS